ncbi:MAG: tRNA (N6-threonylcarbamoyladenosine(37)-N6)-methyltransferase TrmO [Oligoflexales bacterium]|nr:tRNA (N6-threonylcarbamoyladenosine(37)-N6)-methyltransferase TrmO [Oligoflexales bacterium]
MDPITLEPIGKITSCYGQKFGIPRQPGLARRARAVIQLPYDQGAQIKESVRGLEGFSHIWVVFVFHKNNATKRVGLVRPPRLGGEKKVGALASRSPNRPNPIGLSVVELLALHYRKEHVDIVVQGGDFLDTTPVLDIKPYLPYADSLTSATTAWVEPIKDLRLTVSFSELALKAISAEAKNHSELICECIRESLSLDPRPSFGKTKQTQCQQKREWRSLIFGFDVIWTVTDGLCRVENAVLKNRGLVESLIDDQNGFKN